MYDNYAILYILSLCFCFYDDMTLHSAIWLFSKYQVWAVVSSIRICYSESIEGEGGAYRTVATGTRSREVRGRQGCSTGGWSTMSAHADKNGERKDAGK